MGRKAALECSAKVADGGQKERLLSIFAAPPSGKKVDGTFGGHARPIETRFRSGITKDRRGIGKK